MTDGGMLVRSILAMAMLTMMPGAAAVHADTYAVNTTADAVDVAIGNGACATADGTCSLRAAIQEANAHAGADVVTVPAGVFLLSVLGASEVAGATGDLNVADTLEIDGAGRDSTVVDGLDADRIITSTASSLTLRDMTLRHGVASTAGGLYPAPFGSTTIERVRFTANRAGAAGALAQGSGSLTITDSVFDGNIASGGAGAVSFEGTGTLTITNSTFTGNVAAGGVGGAIASDIDGAVALTNCTFSSNFAGGVGGAIEANGPSVFSLDGCTFDGNQATSGAGFYYVGPGNVTVTNTRALSNFVQTSSVGVIVTSGAVRVSGSEFSDNVSFLLGSSLVANGGGGVAVEGSVFRRNIGGGLAGGGGSAAVTITDVESSDNSGGAGTGLYFESATVTLTRARILRNRGGPGGVGAGMYLSGGTVTVSDSTIDGNVGTGEGAGVFAITSEGVAITNSTISGNRASGMPAGGGILGGATVTVTNVTVSGNAADGQGGGLLLGGNATVRNSTFVDNTSPVGSAIFVGGTVTLANSIIAGAAPSHCAGGTPVTSGDFNIDTNGTCALTGANDRSGIDPQLGPLADNGGPTLTHLPAATSPAIDAANPSGCPATDQRGQARPTDGNGDAAAVCDIGAVEFLDLCLADPNKTLPGICGCGVPDTDAALPNGVADCLVNGELKARLARIAAIVAALTGDAGEAALESEATDIAGGLVAYVKQFKAQLVLTDPKAKIDKLVRRVPKAVKKVTKAKAGRKLEKARKKAAAALAKLDAVVAPQ